MVEMRAGDESVAEICRVYGVSRKTAYKWLRRYEEEGEAGLEDRSRAPVHQPHRMGEGVAATIVGLRQEHPRWGARKLNAYLERHLGGFTWPATSSKGHFRCGDGARCDPLTITDGYSRYLLRCRAVAKADGPHVRAVFESVFREYGLPLAIRTDNGPPFASLAPGGLSRLSMWWMRLGIRHERIEPGCPEQNGRHERMHQTLKAETAQPPAANLRRQQDAFERFEREYNAQRPHEALHYATPAEFYVGSDRLYPARVPEMVYPSGMQLRRISQQGSLKWRGERTFLSEILARETVGLMEMDDELYEVYYGPVLLGWFDAHSHVFAEDRTPRRRRRTTSASAAPSKRRYAAGGLRYGRGRPV
jgi:transposase InsO family protein